MDDFRSSSPPLPTAYPGNKKPFRKPLNLPSNQAEDLIPNKEHDDEIVTFDPPNEDLFPNSRPPIFSDPNKSGISKSPHLFTGFFYQRGETAPNIDETQNRPGTEAIHRYNTDDIFTFEEDDLGTKLTIQERMSSPRWQVRKQLYIDIADSLRTGRFLMNIETEMSVFEFFEPLLKDMAWDSNLTSQLEGLQTILVYMKLVPGVKNSLFFLADELIQKCALTKQKSGELVCQIVIELLGKDTEGLLVFYIIKRFTAKNPKEACFALSCIKQALPVLACAESIGKNLANGLNKTLSHSIAEVRNASLALACDLFVYVSDEIDTYIKNLDLKTMQIKEFKETLEAKEKSSSKWTLFNKEKQKAESNDLLILEDTQESLKTDLATLVPEGFFDMPYSSEIKQNREKLVKFSQKLEVPGLIIEKKEYPTIINVLLHLIESNNNLIYTEAIKIVEILVPKIPKSFTYKAKQYIQFLSDKFKEKKKTIIQAASNILHLFRINEVCSFECIIDILLENSIHKVPQVRENSLNWVSSELQKYPATIDLLEINANSSPYEKTIENIINVFGSRILNIALKDTVGSVRDASVKLLYYFKSLNSNNLLLESFLSKLPKKKLPIVENKYEEAEIEIVVKDSSPVPTDFFVEIPAVDDKDQETIVFVIDDIKKYSEGVFRFENLMSHLKTMDVASIASAKQAIVSTITWVFFKINPQKLAIKTENYILELNSLTEAIIREIGSFEDQSLQKMLKMIFQFPAFVSKNWHKSIEATLDVVFMLSNQMTIINCAVGFMGNTRLKKPRITHEEKALICVRFLYAWLVKKIDKNFVKNNSEKSLNLIDTILDIRENDTTFSEQFIKELQLAKNNLSGQIRKYLASGEISPSKSRSPNLSIIEVPEIVDEVSNWNKDIKDIHLALKSANSSQKLSILNKFMDVVENILAYNQNKPQKAPWKRGIGRSQSLGDTQPVKQGLLSLPVEELENFVKDLIFLCTKYKNYTQEPTLFEELQQSTVSALTTLRVVISDKDSEIVFKQLLYHLPVKHSNSSFVKNFNMTVYQLFSDWLAHLATWQVISLVADCFKIDSVFNIHIVYIHTIQWFIEIELKLGNFALEHLSPLVFYVAQGLFGGPLHNSHPLSHSTKQLLIFNSQIFIEYLIEIFTLDNVCGFFEENLVNSGKLYEQFQEWEDKHKKTLECSPETVIVKDESSPEEPSPIRNVRAPERILPENDRVQVDPERFILAAKLEEMSEQHKETRKNLEEVNKEYLTQVTINYELMQKLERAQEKAQKKPEENSPRAKPVETKRTPSFRPLTNFEDLLRPRAEEVPKPAQNKVPVFEFEKLDTPTVPFYMKTTEVYSYQMRFINSKDPEALSSHLLQVYTTLPASHKKPFVQFIYKALENEDLLEALTFPIYKSLVFSILQFCVCEKLASSTTQSFLIKTLANSEDLDLTTELQKLLSLILSIENCTATFKALVQCACETLPETFYLHLSSEKKVFLRLILKCSFKFVSGISSSEKTIRVFDCLLELNKLFLSHPPETLNSDCSDVAEYEHMFKVLRGISDGLIGINPQKAQAFLIFICPNKANKTVYLKYVTALLMKKYNLSN